METKLIVAILSFDLN
ncbi:MAG: hypothetical protein ACLR7Y_15160 [Dysosmobacter sp.]